MSKEYSWVLRAGRVGCRVSFFSFSTSGFGLGGAFSQSKYREQRGEMDV